MRDFANFPNDLPMPGERVTKPAPTKTVKPAERRPVVAIVSHANIEMVLRDEGINAEAFLDAEGAIAEDAALRRINEDVNVVPEDDADDPRVDSMAGVRIVGYDIGRPGGDETCFLLGRQVGKSTLVGAPYRPDAEMLKMKEYIDRMLIEACGLQSMPPVYYGPAIGDLATKGISARKIWSEAANVKLQPYQKQLVDEMVRSIEPGMFGLASRKRGLRGL